MLKLKTLRLIVIMGLILIPASTNAHPGRTDSSGGHTCRTNCEKWGYSTGSYHYHNGGDPAPTKTPAVKAIQDPVTLPTKVPTPTPTKKAIPSPSPSPSPVESPTPEVEGEVLGDVDEMPVEPTPTPTLKKAVQAVEPEEPSGSGGVVATAIVLGAAGGGYALYRRKKKS